MTMSAEPRLRFFNGKEREGEEGEREERLNFLREVNSRFALFPEEERNDASELNEHFRQYTDTAPLLVFIHLSRWEKDFIVEDFEKWSNEFKSSAYVVFFSGGGVGELPTRVQNYDFGGHVFFLRRPFPNSVGQQELRRFVDAFIEGYDDDDFSRQLEEAMAQLNAGSSLDFLSALSILCQGYLAVHSDAEAAQSALSQMDWSDDLMPEEIDLDARRDEVTDPQNGWWQVFNGELKKQAREEWDEDSTEGWKKVSDLIDCISAEEDPGVKTVTSAYCKLAERLGGEPCP